MRLILRQISQPVFPSGGTQKLCLKETLTVARGQLLSSKSEEEDAEIYFVKFVPKSILKVQLGIAIERDCTVTKCDKVFSDSMTYCSEGKVST